MKNLLLRSVTGAVYVAVIVAGVCLGWIAFTLLCCLLAGLATAEFDRLTGQRSALLTVADVIGSVTLVMAFCSMATGPWNSCMPIWALIYVAWLMTRLIVQLFSHNEAPLRVLSTAMMTQLYIALPVALMSVVAVEGGMMMVLGMFVMIWLNDTGAFLVGSAIGRHKLFERLSPKKSWEGFFGGMLFCIGGALLMNYLAGYGFTAIEGVATGVIVAVVATLGDLVESMLKRTLNVKDSGNILPGHGGILDRIDSLLLVTPAMSLWLACLFLL